MASFLLFAVAAAPALGASTAFRISDLDLRDPHVYMDFLGCRDVTDTQLLGYSFNGSVQSLIQTDDDFDGLLDLSFLIIFDPLDQAGAAGQGRLEVCDCTAPMASTVCAPAGSSTSVTTTNSAVGPCLQPIVGTTYLGYSPAVASPAGPCFVTGPTDLTIDLAGILMTLSDVQIAATYLGNPATGLTTGLIRGFMSEADANATLIPNTYSIVGGQPVAILFPGGTGNCSTRNDKDTHNGVPGWWMYFNFTAVAVPYTGPQAGVGDGAGSGRVVLAAPNPFHASLRFDFEMPSRGTARVSVFDLAGRHVADLADGALEAGRHTVVWDGRTADGVRAPSGVYTIRLSVSGGEQVRRVALVR